MIPFPRFPFALCIAVAATLGLLGCKDPNAGGAKGDNKAQSKDADKEKKKDAHAHDHPTAGPHGGTLVEWGDDVFHVEVTIDADSKKATLYVLDDKAKPSPKIVANKISKVKMRVTNAKPVITVDLEHDPKKSGDKDGVAFVGTHERFGQPGDIHGVIDGVVEGHPPFSGDFKFKAVEKKK